MTEEIRGLLEGKVDELSKKFPSISRERVFEILVKTANYVDIPELAKSGSIEDIRIKPFLFFLPSLEEALDFLPAHEAIELFEGCDLRQLAAKTSTLEYWFNKSCPCYTYRELAALINKFIEYLKTSKTSLISTGYPDKSFVSSYWLYCQLSRLYPIKVPHTIQGRGYFNQITDYMHNSVDRDDEGNFIFRYTWLKKKEDVLGSPYHGPDCTYEEAYFIDGLAENDVVVLEENRPKLLNLKLEILNITNEYLTTNLNYYNFWNDCWNAISKKISLQEQQSFDLYEKNYPNMLQLSPYTEGFRFLPSHKIPEFNEDIEPGGIRNLLNFILHIEQELRIGRMNYAKENILQLLNSASPNLAQETVFYSGYGINKQWRGAYGPSPISYYQLISSPKISEIDKVIFDFLSKEGKATEFEKIFNDRLKSDRKEKFESNQFIAVEQYPLVEEFARFIKKGQKLGFEILPPQPIVRISETKEIRPIKLPPGTQWGHITIRFLNGNDVEIGFKKQSIKSDFKQMGFEDERKHCPNNQWRLLYVLARNNGQFSWRDTEADLRYKKTKQLLSQGLKMYFQIDEDPFLLYREEKAYKIKINLIGD